MIILLNINANFDMKQSMINFVTLRSNNIKLSDKNRIIKKPNNINKYAIEQFVVTPSGIEPELPP